MVWTISLRRKKKKPTTPYRNQKTTEKESKLKLKPCRILHGFYYWFITTPDHLILILEIIINSSERVALDNIFKNENFKWKWSQKRKLFDF